MKAMIGTHLPRINLLYSFEVAFHVQHIYSLIIILYMRRNVASTTITILVFSFPKGVKFQ